MNSLDLDIRMNTLETEWRQAYESSMNARADYESMAAGSKVNAHMLDRARERMEHAEAMKARIFAKIERLEESLLRRR